MLKPALGGIMWRTAKRDVAAELGVPAQHHSLINLRLSAIERHFYQRQHTVRFRPGHIAVMQGTVVRVELWTPHSTCLLSEGCMFRCDSEVVADSFGVKCAKGKLHTATFAELQHQLYAGASHGLLLAMSCGESQPFHRRFVPTRPVTCCRQRSCQARQTAMQTGR